MYEALVIKLYLYRLMTQGFCLAYFFQLFLFIVQNTSVLVSISSWSGPLFCRGINAAIYLDAVNAL